MKLSTLGFGLGLGFCVFGLSWAVARHFTGLAQEASTALGIAVALGLLVGAGYVLLESKLFDSTRE